MDMQDLKFTTWTCIHYASGDKLGKMLAHVSVLPVFMVCWQVCKVYCRREVHQVVMLLGLVVSEAIIRVLKDSIQQPRPSNYCTALDVCHSHGMPSSHANMAFTFLALAACSAASLAHKRPRSANAVALLEVAGLAVAAIAIAASRVRLYYHTTEQVAVGALLGSCFGTIWFWFMSALAPWYTWLASLQLLAALGFKNTWGVAEPLLLEQQVYVAGKGSSDGIGSSSGTLQAGAAKPSVRRNAQ